MIQKVIKGKLVAKQSGKFTTYVFEDVDKKDTYIMCTRLPNWECGIIEFDEIGYVKLRYVNAGDIYNTPQLEQKQYKYDQIYFESFIKITTKKTLIL